MAQPGCHAVGIEPYQLARDLADRPVLVVSRLGDRRRNIITNSGRQCGTHCQAFLDELAAALLVGLDADHPIGLLVIKEVACIDTLGSQMVGRGGQQVDRLKQVEGDDRHHHIELEA